MDEEFEIKIVFVGDSRVGKSSLIQRFIVNQCPNTYFPTGFDKYYASFDVDGSRYCANIYDTSGSPTYDTVRPLVYPNTDVFVICFHLNDWYSLQNVYNKWYPEVRKHTKPSTAIVLVGCQNDQRNLDYGSQLYGSPYHLNGSNIGHLPQLPLSHECLKRRSVYTEESLDICRHIGAVTYIETCAYDLHSTQQMFELIALASNGRLQQYQQSTISSTKSSSTNFLLNHVKQLKSSLSGSTTNTSIASSCASSASPSSSSSSGSSIKLKSSSSSTHLLTRHRSLFRIRKCKSKTDIDNGTINNVSSGLVVVDGIKEKSCTIM